MKKTITNGEASLDIEDSTFRAFMKVLAERKRQNRMKAAGRFAYTLRDIQLGDTGKLAVLMEELGELSRAVMEIHGLTKHKKDGPELKNNLLNEVVQVCACAFAWIQCFEDLERERNAFYVTKKVD